jgi:type II secretory pathway pseudopilin PulG
MNWDCPSCRQDNPEEAHFCSACGAPRGEEPQPPQEPAGPAGPGAPQPPPAHPPTAPAKGKSGSKILLFLILGVLLIFCCVVTGIISAIALPNLLDAIQRGKQKRAVAEVRELATAVQAYAKDNDGVCPDTGHEDTVVYKPVDVAKLAPFLVPKYIAKLPAKDRWENPYQYGVSPDDRSFIVICTGSDGVLTLDQVPQEPMETHCYEDDILWENDHFLLSPGGAQKKCK